MPADTRNGPARPVASRCISADSHVTEPAGTYVDRIDPKFRDRAPRMHYDETLGDVMLIDGGKSLVPFWLVAAAGRPTEEVRLDTGQALRRAVARRLGPGRPARRPGPRRRGRGGDLSLRRHVALQLPRRRLPARLLRRVQPLDRRVLRDRARSARRHGPDRVAHAGGRHRRPRVDQGARSARRDAAGPAAARRLRRPDVRRVLGRRGRSRAAAVVPHPHEQDRGAVRQGARPASQHVHDDPAREPGHHRLDDLRRGVRASSAAAHRVRGGRRRAGRRTGCTAPITRTTATGTG